MVAENHPLLLWAPWKAARPISLRFSNGPVGKLQIPFRSNFRRVSSLLYLISVLIRLVATGKRRILMISWRSSRVLRLFTIWMKLTSMLVLLKSSLILKITFRLTINQELLKSLILLLKIQILHKLVLHLMLFMEQMISISSLIRWGVWYKSTCSAIQPTLKNSVI